MKIWLESGFEEVRVSKNGTYILKILPELKAPKEIVNQIISDHISIYHKPETPEQDFTKVAGRIV